MNMLTESQLNILQIFTVTWWCTGSLNPWDPWPYRLPGSAYVILGISGELPNNSGGWETTTYRGCIHGVGNTCVIIH